ncbi:Asp-tRNA(Asn)/Glu-tRNA(Gln) amidotransferase subunit GatA [Patescibacteria group bacterium]|nr:Asp-tRNA(Asn)/Glu-tRNA(Gln) amidotransferase subunit GatA [Patescibacteria group bacterium]MBU4162419.1 Asp-tRNA(Asn)/Glu-tRNA(Gln) amidotransferase subunit GatA [Patescibacteria group bacterium]
MDLSSLTIKKIIRGLESKEFSCKEIIDGYLGNISKKDKTINAFISVFEKEAKEQAKEIDIMISAKSKLLPLAGVALAIKDNILVKGNRSTAGSKILDNYIAPYDATVVKKLKEAGAIIIGKTNMDEFAMGSSGEYSAYGVTKNPNNLEYTPGGSSSGSAAAVTADMCAGALGSDTAGSVRQPASFCGIVGMKPTYGAVSRYGLIAMASSLDQIGVLAKNVEDAKILFDIIKGRDKMDSTSCEMGREYGAIEKPIKDLVIGLPKECFGKGIQKEVRDVLEVSIQRLKESGIKFETLSLPHVGYGVSCYYIITPAEVSSNLARYDGIRYGASEQGDELLDTYMNTRAKYFGNEVKRRIILGAFVLSSGYYDAYYLRAQKVRTKIVEDFKKAFGKVDLILTPTLPTLPFKLGERLDDPLSMYLADLLTVPANLAGLPAISVPAGESSGLPIGLQLIAPHFEEDLLFSAANYFENGIT